LSAGGLILILFVLGLLGILALAGRPSKLGSLSVEDTLAIFSSPTHTSNLSPVLRALRPEDAQFLVSLGQPELAGRLVRQRKRIGLMYLQALQNEFEGLLAASRTLAVMSPHLMPMEEFDRLKLSIRFALLCRYMRIKLRFGLSSSQGGFDRLSAMAVRISIAMEEATVASAERAVAGSQ
jgi:hypothetical protein